MACQLLVVAAATAKLLQSYPTLCDPIDGSPPGSSVPGILQARILEWVAISFSLVVACGIYFSDQGLNPNPLHWKLGILAIDDQGSPSILDIYNNPPNLAKL